MKPSEGSYAAQVTAQRSSHIVRGCMDLAPAGLSTGCCGSSELPEVSRAWLLAACICIASSSTCSSRDEEGKGSVSPGREVPIGRRAIKPVWPSVWHAPCLVEEVTLLSPALSSTQLPCNEGFLSFASFCFQRCGPKLLAAAASVSCSAERQTPACPMGCWLLSAQGGWQEARDVFLPAKQMFIPKKEEKNQAENVQ